VSRLALGPTQPPIQLVPGVLSFGVKCGRGVTVTTHTHLMTRSRLSRSYMSSRPSASVVCSGTTLLYGVRAGKCIDHKPQYYSVTKHPFQSHENHLQCGQLLNLTEIADTVIPCLLAAQKILSTFASHNYQN
jgi:hypothetical protein